MAQGITAAILEVQEEEKKKKSCAVCNDFCCEDSVEFDIHKQTTRHIYNAALQEFKEKRLKNCKDRDGITITIGCKTHEIKYERNSGRAESIIQFDSGDTELKYTFVVKNTSDKELFLKKVSLLHPLKNFRLSYKHEKQNTAIRKGFSRNVVVDFTSSGIGYYEVPVSFIFQRNKKEISIVKSMVVSIPRDEYYGDKDDSKSPFRAEPWPLKMDVVPGTRSDGRKIDKLTDYPIPRECIPIFKHKLQVWENITDDQVDLLYNILQSFPREVGYNEGFMAVHNYFFHTMLHLDEFRAVAALNNYNMFNVPIHLVIRNRVELMVPGLAEKRPSLLKLDIVQVRVRLNDNDAEMTAFEGFISEVRDSVIWISGFDPSLLYRLEKGGSLNVDVRFMLNRYPLVTQHNALDWVMDKNLLPVIFPMKRAQMKPLIQDHTYTLINREILGNEEQRSAVDNIVKGTSRPAPYIVFGPPGTGKTVTLVEAILQIRSLFKKSYTLVCAPSNAACDHIALQLMDKCSKYDLLRMHSRSRDLDAIPKKLHNYSNIDGDKVINMQKHQLLEFRIIVCTLISAAKFVSSGESNHFTHVFVDEAGQAVEPEALVAIGGILGQAKQGDVGGQLVLAGDPQQLGPICSSSLAENAGLGVSLLERLMSNCPLYQRGEDNNFNKRYITKLLDNYRSHPTLLKLPNQLFYDGELRAKCGPDIMNDPLCTAPLLDNKEPGQTCIFHGVIGQELREGKSPSYYNQMEIDAVMLYVKALLSSTSPVEVLPTDIGIIAPYIRQVYKLKDILKRKNWGDVEVGTTEVFQGREKRVILISTVRSNRNLLDYDKLHKLGFLVDKRRFNVATTRARARLIVVGCPYLLDMDENWRELIKYTTALKSYKGCEVPLYTEPWAMDVTKRVKGVMNLEE